MKFLRRNRHTMSVPYTPLTNWGALRAQEARAREVGALERANLLKEFELLRKVRDVAELDAVQRRRLAALTESLWPPPERNPMNGIRRVPGGHGYPIPDQKPPLSAADAARKATDVGADRY